jgi:hypothetical protein
MNLDLVLFQLLEKEIGDRLEHYASELVAGKPVDFTSYKMIVGRIKGLQEALEVAREANRKAIGLEDKDR